MMEFIVYAGLIAIPLNWILANHTEKNLPEWIIYIGQGYIDFITSVFG